MVHNFTITEFATRNGLPCCAGTYGDHRWKFNPIKAGQEGFWSLKATSFPDVDLDDIVVTTRYGFTVSGMFDLSGRPEQVIALITKVLDEEVAHRVR